MAATVNRSSGGQRRPPAPPADVGDKVVCRRGGENAPGAQEIPPMGSTCSPGARSAPAPGSSTWSTASDAGRVYVATARTTASSLDGQGACLDQWNDMHRPCGLLVSGDRAYIGQLASHLDVNAPTRTSAPASPSTTCKATSSPASAALTPARGRGSTRRPTAWRWTRGDLYVGEVSWSAYGRRLDPPRLVRCSRSWSGCEGGPGTVDKGVQVPVWSVPSHVRPPTPITGEPR